MLNVIICGACGKMGANVLELLNAEENMQAVCGVDYFPREIGIPVFKSFDEVNVKGDVIIDFSSSENLEERLKFAKENDTPIVLASTGFSKEDLALIDEYSKNVALFKTANLSLGVNLLQLLVKKAAEILDGFDVEIIEKHHNLKKDAPSGTAIMLAESVNEGREEKLSYVYGREGIVGKRKDTELGMHAVRGGTIVGEHEVMFAGEDEIITLSHSARSKKVFAQGAIKAAAFIAGKEAGIYDMKDVLGNL